MSRYNNVPVLQSSCATSTACPSSAPGSTYYARCLWANANNCLGGTLDTYLYDCSQGDYVLFPEMDVRVYRINF